MTKQTISKIAYLEDIGGDFHSLKITSGGEEVKIF
jgi:hypothetical protein